MSIASLVFNVMAKTDNFEKGMQKSHTELKKLSQSAKMFGGSMGSALGVVGRSGAAVAAFYAMSRAASEVASNADKFKGILSEEQISRAMVFSELLEKQKTQMTALAAIAAGFFSDWEEAIRRTQPIMNWEGINKNRAKQDEIAESIKRKLDPEYAALKEYEEQIRVLQSQLDRNQITTGDFEYWKGKAYSQYQEKLPANQASRKAEEDRQKNDLADEIEKEQQRYNITDKIKQRQKDYEDSMRRMLGVSERMIEVDNLRLEIEEKMKDYSKEQQEMWQERLKILEKIAVELDEIEAKEKAKEKEEKEKAKEKRHEMQYEGGEFMQFNPADISLSALAMRGGINYEQQSLNFQRQTAQNTEKIANTRAVA
jgi:hypothetical protein